MSIQLTPEQEHFLKKELLTIELNREINALAPDYNDALGLRRFGIPFAMYDPKNPPADRKEAKRHAQEYAEICEAQFPLLKHIFSNYIVTFPFIYNYLHLTGDSEAKADAFWIEKIQRFYEIWKSKKISNSTDRGTTSKSKLLVHKLMSALVMYFNSGILVMNDKAYFEADKDTRNLYKKVDKVVKSDLTLEDVLSYEDDYINDLDINVVAVTVERVTKAKVRRFLFSGREETKSVYEFIIRVKYKSDGKVRYVKRRYSEFAAVDKKLGKKFAGHNLPFLPRKNKDSTGIDVSGDNDENVEDDDFDVSSNPENNSMSSAMEKFESSLVNSLRISASDIKESSIGAIGSIPLFSKSSPAPSSVPNSSNGCSQDSKSTISTFKSSTNSLASFPREKTRIALRGYLRDLLRIKIVANSQLFLNFIQDNEFENLTPEEQADAESREKLDNLILAQQFKFQQETIEALKEIQKHANELKTEIVTGSNGLYYLFNQLEHKKTSKELSKPVQAFIQLAQIEVAATLYEIFIGNDNSMANLSMLKTFNFYFPYNVIASVMRFTNPLQIAKKLIDLFLFQMPIGFNGKKSRSLMQILFTGSLNDELKKINKNLDNIANTLVGLNQISPVDCRDIINKLNEYAQCKEEEVLLIKKNSHYYKIDLALSVILNNNKLPTNVRNEALAKIIDSYKSWLHLQELVKDTDSVDVSKDSHHINKFTESAELYSTVHAYFLAVLNKHDKLRVVEMWDEPELIELIKELVAIFFQPLIQLFKEAQLYLYLPILQKYVTELVQLIDYYQNDYNALLSKNNNVVNSFVGLQNKYQEDLYTFMRNVYIGDLNSKNKVFTSFITYFNTFIKFINFVKDARPDLMMNLSGLINELPDDKIDKKKLLQEINHIVDQINDKRKKYEELSKKTLEKEGVTLDRSNDALAMGRKKALTKNWNIINDSITQNMQSFTGQADFASGVLGVNEQDLIDVDLDFQDLYHKNKFESVFYKFKGEKVLSFIEKHANKVESDESFKKSNEFGDLQENEEISKLADTFKEKVYAILKEYK